MSPAHHEPCTIPDPHSNGQVLQDAGQWRSSWQEHGGKGTGGTKALPGGIYLLSKRGEAVDPAAEG